MSQNSLSPVSPHRSLFQNNPWTIIRQVDIALPVLFPEWERPALGRAVFVNGAFVIDAIKHAADIFTIDQSVLEGKPAVGRPNVSIGKDPQLHAPELGDINHFLFRDPDIAAPAAAGTAAGGAGGLVESEGVIRVISHQ